MISILQRGAVRGRVWPSTLRRRAARLLAELGEAEADLVIVLTDDAEIHELNQTWREKDRPTDVLSFPQREGEMPPLPEGAVWPLGDVVISLDTAARQADEDGCLPRLWPALGATSAPEWRLLDEVTFLLVHGVLHLCGEDHLEPEDAAVMEAKEAALLPGLLGRRPRV